MKEKLITLINILGNNSQINGPFYVDDLVVDSIRIFDSNLEFKIPTDAKCQFGKFEFWVLYDNMESKHLELISERLINLI